MRIYTGGGDGGETGLFGGGRTRKDDPRVEAYGGVDELNALLGVARAAGLPADLDALAGRLQEQLFELGADLAAPPDARAREDRIVRLGPDAAKALEAEIDRCEAELEQLRTFILPGGGGAGAALHHARAVCRRVERRVVALHEASPGTIPYLNRLSDLLFVMARLANTREGRPERAWQPPT